MYCVDYNNETVHINTYVYVHNDISLNITVFTQLWLALVVVSMYIRMYVHADIHLLMWGSKFTSMWKSGVLMEKRVRLHC